MNTITKIPLSVQTLWADIDRRKAKLQAAWPSTWPSPCNVWAFDAIGDFIVLFDEETSPVARGKLPFEPLVQIPCLNGQRVKLACRMLDYERKLATPAGFLMPMHGGNLAGITLGKFAQGYVRLHDWLICVQTRGELVEQPLANVWPVYPC